MSRHREIQWAPVPIWCDAGIAAWRPGWLCPGCATEVAIPADAGGPCHRTIFLELHPRVHGTCHTPRCTPPPAPAPHAATHLPDAPAGAQQGPSRPAAAFWLTRGPPLGLGAGRTNCWVYVRFLHAAAADLAPFARGPTLACTFGGSKLVSFLRPRHRSPRRPSLLHSPALPKPPENAHHPPSSSGDARASAARGGAGRGRRRPSLLSPSHSARQTLSPHPLPMHHCQATHGSCARSTALCPCPRLCCWTFWRHQRASPHPPGQ